VGDYSNYLKLELLSNLYDSAQYRVRMNQYVHYFNTPYPIAESFCSIWFKILASKVRPLSHIADGSSLLLFDRTCSSGLTGAELPHPWAFDLSKIRE
jgi:hypothetical protein